MPHRQSATLQVQTTHHDECDNDAPPVEHSDRPGAPERAGAACSGHEMGSTARDYRHGLQLGPPVGTLAAGVRPGVLRDRDDLHGFEPVRHRPVRRRGLPRVAAASRPDDCLGHRHQDDDADDRPAVRPDAGAEIRDRDGRLRHRRRPVQGGLQRRVGRRQVHPGRRVYSRLPAHAAGASERIDRSAEEDRRRAAGDSAPQ